MLKLSTLRRFALAGLLAASALGIAASAAQAGGYGCEFGHGYRHEHHSSGHHVAHHSYRPHDHGNWVVSYECRREPYTKCITLYDHCGRPYEITKTFYRTVHVPVKKFVAYRW